MYSKSVSRKLQSYILLGLLLIGVYAFLYEGVNFTAFASGNPPTQGTPLLVSSMGTNTTSENLICTNQSTSDPEGDSVTNIYHWYKNNTSLTNLLMPFDTNSSAIVKDYSGYGNAGTTNATWDSTGKVGGCYSFDGTGTAVSVPDASSLDGDGTWTAMTVEQWIYLSASQTGTQIIAKMSTTAEAKRSYQIGIQSATANQMYAAFMVGSNSYQELVYTTSLLNSSQWYYVALTYKSGDRVRLYVDGVQVNASAATVTGNIQASPDKPLLIGRRFDGRSFKGKIDEVRLYNYSLSAAQILQRYAESKDGFSDSSTVVPPETVLNDVWKCEVTPNDGTQDGTAAFSNTLQIIPTAPSNYDDVVFDSGFEMGNLINVQFQSGDSGGFRYYTAELNYSTATFSDNHAWFYFSMQNVTGKTVKVQLKNLATADFSSRWQNVEPVYTYDNDAWSFVPTGNYSCGDATTRDFNITLSPAQDKVWLARVPAYTVTMRDSLFASYASSTYLTVTSLGTTPLGQSLKVATITDPAYSDSGKFKVYIIAQQHSGETVPSFVAEGMIRFLLDETNSTAAALRKSYIFKIVPIVNVEGNHYGICRYTPFRSGIQYDLNRAWDDSPISALTTPEINWTFTDVQNWMPNAFIDLHSDSTSLDCFFLHDGLADATMVNFMNNVSRGYTGTKDYWPETGSRATGNAEAAPWNIRTKLGIHPATMMEHPNDDRSNTTAHPTDHNPQTTNDWREWGKRAVLGLYDYFGDAGAPNLVIDSVVIKDQGCKIYANDTYAGGSDFSVPVEVTVINSGNSTAGQFNVSLQVYWTTGSQQESNVQQTVASLDAGKNVTLTFYFRPTHTRYYVLTATADCNNAIVESNETDNSLSRPDIPVTTIGDINGDGVVNIFDAVVISLAWGSTPIDSYWNIRADINHDNTVDLLDGTRIDLHWGQTW